MTYSRVLDDSHLQSLVLELLQEKKDILQLVTVSKSWHSIAQPALFRRLTLHQPYQVSRVVNAIEYWQKQGRATHAWIRELYLIVLELAATDLRSWTDVVIRILVHAQHVQAIVLHPCSPAMLAVASASATCAGALRFLNMSILPNVITFSNVAYLSQFKNLQGLNLDTDTWGVPWTQEQLMLAPGGHLPSLRRLTGTFEGKQQSHLFHFLVSCSFDMLEEVDVTIFELTVEDCKRLRVFLGAHALKMFGLRCKQTADQTLDILQNVRAAQLGLSILHLLPPYTAYLRAVPQTTPSLLVHYEDVDEESIVSLMQELSELPTPIQSVVVRDEPQIPFRWFVDLTTMDVADAAYAGRRLILAMRWAHILAKRGIRLLDEDRRTLRESITGIP